MSDLDEAIAIARELARLATLPGNPPPYSIGTQLARLQELEQRIARTREFDQATGATT